MLTTCLLVELLHDVGGNREVEPSETLLPDALGENSHLVEGLLDVVVVLLIVDNEENGHFLSPIIDLVLIADVLDSMSDLLLNLLVVLVGTIRIADGHLLDVLDAHAKLTLATGELLHDLVKIISSEFVVVHQEDAPLFKRFAVVDRHLLEQLLIAEEVVVARLVLKHGHCKLPGVHRQRFGLDLNAPL